MRVADYIAQFLKKNGVTDIFMLTGYGAMYLNDAIEVAGIRHYACRNEAVAPMMAESYARIKQSLGVACVTAGPGSTNAIPGLAEAWVDSAPVLMLSGQVDIAHTTRATKLPKFRTFGTAEIDVIPVVESITKFSAEVTDPYTIRYYLEKALHYALSGRPGPVWLSIPIDVQRCEINESKLQGFTPDESIPTTDDTTIERIANLLCQAQKPLIVYGQGVRQSDTSKDLLNLINTLRIPAICSRLGQDILPHSGYVFGHGGVKGTTPCKQIMGQADFVLSLGCRLAIQFVGMTLQHFSPTAKVVAIDIDQNELLKPGVKLTEGILADLREFMPKFLNYINHQKLPDWSMWVEECRTFEDSICVIGMKRNPIDLYYFMSRLDALSTNKHILTTDAGSNYYVGGQVFTFQRQQREVTSGAFAAMGTSIPLAVGAAVADPDKQILAVTGDGSLELNIQELKTISHYGFNIKLFVINNGGYVSMKKWQDMYFDGRRIDEEETTGVGTLNLQKIANAFDLPYTRIDDYTCIDSNLHEIMSDNKPIFVEVMTDTCQKIHDA